MKLIKKGVLSGIIFAMTLLMTACSKYKVKDEQVGQKALFPDYEYNQELAQQIYGQSKMAIAPNGYYYIIDNVLYFYNIDSDINMPLCSKVNCRHNDNTCDAYVSTINTENGTFECNCMGEKIMYYNGSIYCIEVTKDRDYYLYQYDSTFSNRKQVTRLASIKDEQLMVSDAQACLISDGYMYYYASYLDSKYAENDYTASFYACRIKLDNNSSREVLGEFQFPGDYAMKAGQSNGFSIYFTDNSIYFYAGGAARMYTANNSVQYHVSKYNPDKSQYTDLYVHSGNSGLNVFGEGTGYVNSMSQGGYVRTDSEGNFYIMTSSKAKDNNNIIKVNFDKNTCEVIYTTQMEKLDYLQSDGEYLYFFESDSVKDKKSLLTVIDMSGNVKTQYEMEYDEEYMAEMQKHSGQNVNGNSYKPDASDILVYGLDGRYIVLGSRTTGFKNLTTSDTVDYKKEPVVGVGIINTKDYLSGSNVSIKQIYQYAR